MASKKCKEHQYHELPLVARNGRKYQKCRICNTVTFVKGYEMVMSPKVKVESPLQLSMVSENFGRPRAMNSDGTEYYYKKPSRRKQPKIVHMGMWS